MVKFTPCNTPHYCVRSLGMLENSTSEMIALWFSTFATRHRGEHCSNVHVIWQYYIQLSWPLFRLALGKANLFGQDAKKKIQPEGNVLGHSAIQDNKSGLKSFSLKKQGENCFHLISNWQLFFPCTKQSINLMQCEVYFLWKQLLSNIHCIYSLDQTHSKICN